MAMSIRRFVRPVAILSLSLTLSALWDGRASAQATSRGGTGGTGRSSGSSSSASSVGGGFTGGGNSTGGGFTGGGTSGSTSSGGFTGSTSAQGGARGGTGGGITGGTSTTVPSQANPFLSTYVNPLTVGMVDVTGKQTVNKAFGQPMYNVISTATTGTGQGN